jgi:hypothetical protein
VSVEIYLFIYIYIRSITPVSLWDRQRSLLSICYDPYTHLSLLPSTSTVIKTVEEVVCVILIHVRRFRVLLPFS